MDEPKVIFTDNHLLVVNKPNGIATQPDLEEWAKEWMGRPFVHAVHRLDRPASGIVLLAKTSKALSRLQESLRLNLFHKTYYALVENIPDNKEGFFEDLLVHDDFRARVVHQGGKKAQLKYKVVETRGQIALVEITLLTGRYHQIRVQWASRGHPILGDRKYGSHYEFMPLGIALHHRFLSFPHPVTKEELRFEASFPDSWNCRF